MTPEFNWDDLWLAYQSDGYIHRAVNRYRMLVLGRGVKIEAPPRIQRYLDERFRIMKSVNGLGWDDLLRVAALDYVLFGNAFMIRAGSSQIRAVYGYRINTQRATAALYPVSPRMLRPVFSPAGEVVAWQLYVRTSRAGHVVPPKEFNSREVLHLHYNRGSEYVFGTPLLLCVLEDVRALRQIEEDILRLLHKFANPLLVINTPDALGYGDGIRADMTELANVINQMAEDGFLVLMPGQDVRMLGAESVALRMEGYLDSFKRRVFSGLGMSANMLADESEPLERQVELERQIRDTVTDIQHQFGQHLLDQVIGVLLQEAGIETDEVSLVFDLPDQQAWLRFEQAVANLYALNLITRDEARKRSGLTEPFDEKDSYLWRVSLPRVLEPLRMQLRYGLAGSSAQGPGGSAPAGSGGGDPAVIPSPTGPRVTRRQAGRPPRTGTEPV